MNPLFEFAATVIICCGAICALVATIAFVHGAASGLLARWKY